MWSKAKFHNHRTSIPPKVLYIATCVALVMYIDIVIKSHNKFVWMYQQIASYTKACIISVMHDL